MRKIDENRAMNYIRKHERYKKWLVFALCISILSGSLTFYMLNKPATAMTEEGAKSVGLVLDTADAEFEQSLIEQMLEEERASEEEQLLELFGETSDEEEEEDLILDGESEDDSELSDEAEEEDLSGEDLTDDEEGESKVVKKIIKKVSTKSTNKSTDSALDEEKEDVVITVLYQDKAGEDIEESKELSITESFDLKEEAREFEGYIFTKGLIGEDEVVSIVKKTSDDAEVKESSEAVTSDDDEEETEIVRETEEIVFLDADTDEEVQAADSESGYTYYEATLADGNILVIDEDVDLTLVYTKVNEKEVFEYEADGVKVTVKLSDPAVLPDGAELKVNTLDENTYGYNYDAYIAALNANAEAIAKANGTEEAVEYDSKNVALFDICFMYEDKEFQLEEGTASVSIVFTDNKISDELGASDSEEVTVVHMPVAQEILQEVDSTREATDISAGDITVEVLTQSIVDLDGNADEISFETTSFSVYGAVMGTGDHTWEGSKSYSAQDIVKMFGDATYFGVVANSYDGNNNHSEANIAVKTISNIQQFSVGNSTTVYSHLTDYNVTVNKVVYGATKVGTFNFALFSDIGGTNKISGSEFSISTGSDGTGSYSMDVVDYIKSYASLYVYELDGNGNAILNGTTSGSYTVTYEGDAIEGNSDIVSYFSDNYIENIGKYLITGDTGILQKVEGATIYYKTSDSTYVGVQYVSGGEVVRTYEGAFPVSVDSMRGTAEEASSRLAYATSTDNVEVVNIIGSAPTEYSEGNLKTDLSKYYFKNANDINNYAVNTGFFIGDDTLLVINVDLTGIDSYTYNKITVNRKGTGDWNDIANQIVVNFVEKDDNGDYVPYTGTINADTASGLLVAPDANVNLYSSYAGTVIADDVNKVCEIHKITVRRFLSENGTATVTNVIDGAVASVQLYKYLNNENPGDLQFTFTVRALKHKTGGLNNTEYYLETLTNELTNIGSEINYTFDYDSYYITYDSDGKSNPRVWLVINENDIDATKYTQSITKDYDYIIARIALNEDLKSVKNVYYFNYDSENQSDLISGIESGISDTVKNAVVSYITKAADGNAISDLTKVAFYNEGSGLLRIHKMVVNDYASDVIRNNPKAILQNVWFRITNNSSGVYLAFQGFVGSSGTEQTWTDTAGKEHVITYNDATQWTIQGLDAGTYTVEEVGDGYTFGYDKATNKSYFIDSRELTGSDVSRITKYAVTVDDDEDGYHYGTGGNNWRKLFSHDVSAVKELEDDAPDYVTVGGKTETVQIANYYSLPVGPIQFTKNFSGAEWTSEMAFTFEIAAVGFRAYTSENELITDIEQPMPQKLNSTEVQDTVTITGADATYDETTGTYTATAQFSSIPFRYKGTYVYKITETNTGVDGIKYDSKVYYVRVDVKNMYTTFVKRYSYGNNPHTIYVQNGNTNTVEINNEDFYYLGAEITYATDAGFKDVVAFCTLSLPEGEDPQTVDFSKNVFQIDWDDTIGDVADVAFNNVKTGDLKVKKVWKDQAGTVVSKDQDSSLPLSIWQKTENAQTWTLYGAVVLSNDNNWEATVPVPVTDTNGNRYVYTIKEPDKYLNTYVVTYTYNENDYAGNEQQIITMGEESVRDTGYVMTNGNGGFGEVVITNQALSTNELPSTGGMGTTQYAALGALLIAIAFAGMMLLKKVILI